MTTDTCAPGTHYFVGKTHHSVSRCVYCSTPSTTKPRSAGNPVCPDCGGIRVVSFVWVGPGPALADWREELCPTCDASAGTAGSGAEPHMTGRAREAGDG